MASSCSDCVWNLDDETTDCGDAFELGDDWEHFRNHFGMGCPLYQPVVAHRFED